MLALAQYGSITGKITRADSKGAVAHASVFLSNSSFGTSSNDDGNYTLNNVRPGQYTLVVTAIGYDDISKLCWLPISQLTWTYHFLQKQFN